MKDTAEDRFAEAARLDTQVRHARAAKLLGKKGS